MPESTRDVALSRRRFFQAMGAGTATTLAVAAGLADARLAFAQEAAASSASNVPMDPSGYREIRLPAKAGAKPQLTQLQRDALEKTLKCQCPCTLDVYTCRTTDFSCGISPAMHKDVMTLVDGGYSADEIVGAFKRTCGERVLMSPTKEGFNWAGYVAPFVALGAGATVLTALIRKWGQRAALAKPVAAPHIGAPSATPDEMARLEAALRDDA